MSIAQQLYHLQELDTQVESGEQALQRMNGQIGESPALIAARTALTTEKQHLESLKNEQRGLEIEASDITVKLKAAGDELYSGRIRNPKELASLQQDIEMLKSKRGKIDDKVLELMDQVEQHAQNIAGLGGRFTEMEAGWKVDQQKLAADIEKLQAEIANAAQEKLLLTSHLDPKALTIYNGLKIKRKTSVAKVTQGICLGCRMSLPSTEMQKIRGGGIVQCSSCGRILYLA